MKKTLIFTSLELEFQDYVMTITVEVWVNKKWLQIYATEMQIQIISGQ